MVRTNKFKYEAMVASLDAKVAPAVFETFGDLTSSCRELFKRIADITLENPYCCWSRHEIYSGLCLETSIILQTWNAKILKRAKLPRLFHKRSRRGRARLS